MKNFRISSVFKTILLICVFGLFIRKANSCSNSNTMSDAEFRQEMIELATETNNQCPMDMDGVGTLSSVELKGNTFEATINIINDYFDYVDVNELKINTIKSMRSETSMEEFSYFANLFQEYGYSYNFNFYNSNGELIEVMTITGNDLLNQL